MTGNVDVIAITDCGSTTTKAILVEKVDGVFRQTFRAEAPTTVEAPLEDVTIGVRSALRQLGESSGRRLIGDNGEIIRPASGRNGVDLYLSTSSAGGGLQMVVVGVVRRMSAESAERAALGAGAIVADVVAMDDDEKLHDRIERMRRLRPDMILLSGGVDGGASVPVMEMAELLASADPRPRFGAGFKVPVIFAGNNELKSGIESVLGKKYDLFPVENVRPTVDEEALGPARETIHKLFLEHVMRQAPGFSRLVEWADQAVMPTPSAVGEILRAVCEERGMSVLCVDIGGATTDIFSLVRGAFTRTVSANLGLSYSASNVLSRCGAENLMRWLPFEIGADRIRNMVMNKTIRPTTVPDSMEELLLEQALAREAMRLSFLQHSDFVADLRGRRRAADFAGAFNIPSEQSKLRPMEIDLIIGSGGVLSHAPQPWQTAAMMIDAFMPEGVTLLAKDSIFMMPHLGVLSRFMPDAAKKIFELDCMESLGVCVAPVGEGKQGKPCLEYRLSTSSGRTVQGRLKFGELTLEPLESGENGLLELQPGRRFDVGAGKGKPWSGRVDGGPAGVVFDGRGRPIRWPEDLADRREAAKQWNGAYEAARGSKEGG